MPTSNPFPLLFRLICIILMLNLFGCKSTKTDPTIKLPVVGAATVADITPTTAKATSRLSDVGAGVTGVPTIKEYGICFGGKENPTTADSKITSGNATTAAADITATLTGLTPGTAYYVRGYATHDGGTVYGDQATFTTGNLKAPTVNSNAGFDITRSGFSVLADLLTIGTSAVTQYGHVLSETNQTPTLADTKTELGTANTPKAYQSSFANLKQNTTYYVRAYATNAAGTGYGNAVIVKTLNEVAPSVTTQTIDLVTGSTARGAGSISSAGTSPITGYGHCWSSTNQNPTPADNRIDFGSTNAPKDFSTAIVNLTSNTTYYVRAYATSSAGTGYGETKTIKTLNELAPTVETLAPSSVSFFNAYVDGRVLTLGTSPVTQHGHCWSITNVNPTIADSKDTRGATTTVGTGFTSMRIDLPAGTTCYYRTYATNSAGTGYGEVKTFTTRLAIPTVKTNSDGVLTGRTVWTIGGQILSTGATNVTVYGHCWSATNNVPTTADSKNQLIPTSSQMNLLSYKYVSDLIGLTPNTTYYMRGYATNSWGTAYGEVYTFTTLK